MSLETPKNKQVEDYQSLEKVVDEIQILIAESEDELVSLFEAYLSLLGMKTEIASSGEKALDCFLDSKKKDRPYDAIILDTHLPNPSGLDVAKRIRREKPDQKVVIVTTSPREYLPSECLETAGIKDKDILTMPFRISRLGLVPVPQLLFQPDPIDEYEFRPVPIDIHLGIIKIPTEEILDDFGINTTESVIVGTDRTEVLNRLQTSFVMEFKRYGNSKNQSLKHT